MLEQFVAKLCRKAALIKVSARRKKKFAPTPNQLEEHLGSARFQTELAQKTIKPGIVTGLAWTSYGGQILFIETIPLKGKGTFKLTGQMGNVMNESANIAYSYVKSLLEEDLDAQKAKKKSSKKVKPAVEAQCEDALDFLSEHEVHLHLPAGATPKDGPSAGITMALALYSLATDNKIKNGLAMTGELSLTGRVLWIQR